MKHLSGSSKTGLDPFFILSRVDHEFKRYGFLHRYLYAAKAFEKYAYDERIQLIQQLEFIIGLGQHGSGFSERQQDEQRFYNAVYSKYELGEKAITAIDPNEIPVTNCGMEPYLEEIFGKMMPLQHKNVLEVGGGGGLFALWMALQGAKVTIIDVSDQALEFAKRRECKLRKRYPGRFTAPVRYRVAPAEHLDIEFPDDIFDFIFAYAVTHHLETESFAYALNKALKPDGTIFLCYEPLFFSRGLKALRYSKPMLRIFSEGKETQFERRLHYRDIGYFRKYFTVQLLPSNLYFFNVMQKIFLNTKHPWFWSLFRILIWPQKKTKWSFDQFGDITSRCLQREYDLLRRRPFLKIFCGNASLILKKR